MRVFLTGATGYVGHAIATSLLRAGHEVTALVRSSVKAQEVTALGAVSVLGDLGAPDTYRQTAAEHDVLIHAAFEYDPSGQEVRSIEETAVETLLDVAETSPGVRQILYTSSVYLLDAVQTERIDENADTVAASLHSQWRLGIEGEVLRRAGETFRAAVVRAGLVYGGRGGTLPEIFGGVERDDAVAYYGEGQNRWTLVYLGDLARLYLAVVESEGEGVFHGVDGSPMAAAHVAEAASQAAGREGRTRSIPLDVARAQLGEYFDRALGRDVAVVATRSIDLGWQPTFASFAEGASVAYAEWIAV